MSLSERFQFIDNSGKQKWCHHQTTAVVTGSNFQTGPALYTGQSCFSHISSGKRADGILFVIWCSCMSRSRSILIYCRRHSAIEVCCHAVLHHKLLVYQPLNAKHTGNHSPCSRISMYTIAPPPPLEDLVCEVFEQSVYRVKLTSSSTECHLGSIANCNRTVTSFTSASVACHCQIFKFAYQTRAHSLLLYPWTLQSPLQPYLWSEVPVQP